MKIGRQMLPRLVFAAFLSLAGTNAGCLAQKSSGLYRLSFSGITIPKGAKAAWELTPPETGNLLRFLQRVYINALRDLLVRGQGHSFRFEKTTVNYSPEKDEKFDSPVTTLKALISLAPTGRPVDKTVLHRAIARELESNAPGYIADFEIKMDSYFTSRYGRQYFWITVIPYAINTGKVKF